MRILRNLLVPFALLYGSIILVRNFLYDSGIWKSRSYGFPVVGVGNLSAGGTGKSPMIEYLVSLLSRRYQVATLSRGYKRKTRGYHLVQGEEAADQTGDEPLQFKRKFPQVFVAVDADRRHGITMLRREKAEVILLDDAFQHRKVHPGLNMLLTSYSSLYTEDFMLPTGNLREPSFGAERADIIVVTKCPPLLGPKEQEALRGRLRPMNYQQVYFTSISYADTVQGGRGQDFLNNFGKRSFTLVTGIANPAPLVEFLRRQHFDFEHLKFRDHHNFTKKELAELEKKSLVLTTEKDYMRLEGHLAAEKLWYLPIQIKFLSGEEHFQKQVLDFIKETENQPSSPSTESALI